MDPSLSNFENSIQSAAGPQMGSGQSSLFVFQLIRNSFVFKLLVYLTVTGGTMRRRAPDRYSMVRINSSNFELGRGGGHHGAAEQAQMIKCGNMVAGQGSTVSEKLDWVRSILILLAK